jgi:ubiquinone/menaquinone biosynthesis C-methylase UbiE
MDPQKRWDLNSYFYDIWTAPMEFMGGHAWRTMLFSQLPEGKILEVGIGTGANIPFYLPENRSYTGIDLSPNMLKRAALRAAHHKTDVVLQVMDIEHMDFSNETFDAAVSTCVFCSVPDPIRGLRGIRRVMKKEGVALFIEHMRPNKESLGKIFDILNPFTAKFMGGSINRRTTENIKNAGFDIVEEQMLFWDVFRFIKAKPHQNIF